jgi:phospholipid/cholesterol/gamma-HCH transport system permease protein
MTGEPRMAFASIELRTWVTVLGDAGYRGVIGLGDLTIFSGRTLGWMVRRRPTRGTLLTSCHMVGVRSVPVVAITGVFIGMVLAVQSYSQFHRLGLDSRLGAIINISVVRELGPVLAATMIAGRVGSAMAAELGTMTITDQVDALTCLGVPAVHYLVVPRYLACVLLIPLLTVLADFTGIFGGVLISTQIYHVETYYYWARAREAVHLWDISTGLIKSLAFGAAIALISCHQGFQCRAGAEGVGRAATQAFVLSFIAILALDFFLGVFLNSLSERWWPEAHGALL